MLIDPSGSKFSLLYFTSINTMTAIPERYAKHLQSDAKVSLVQCPSSRCLKIPTYFSIVEGDRTLKPGKCLQAKCDNVACKRGNFWICCTCSQKFDRHKRAVDHFKSDNHMKKFNDLTEVDLGLDQFEMADEPDQPPPPLDVPPTDHHDDDNSPSKRSYEDAFGANCSFHEVNSPATTTNNQLGVFEASPIIGDNNNDAIPGLQLGHYSRDFANKPNRPTAPDLLGKKLRNMQEASVDEIGDVFLENEAMKLFWTAEHASPNGKMGGGMRYLVGRAFQKSKLLRPGAIPNYEESRWHMRHFYYGVQQTEKDREMLLQVLADLRGNQELFVHSWIPRDPAELRQIYYGSTNSLWNTLPIPTVQKVGDIAYTSPMDLALYAFAVGIKVDPIVVTADFDLEEHMKEHRRVFHVSDCQRVTEMKQAVSTVLKRGDKEYDLVVILPCNDWKDGHGVNRTKNNRPSAVSWSWTMSPLKDNVNSTDNTLPIAIGAKKSEHWQAVEHRFVEDLKKLGTPEEPLRLYYGPERKIVRVYAKRINSLEDKIERAETTFTLGPSSNMHKRFGYLGAFETPYCNVEEVKKANKKTWGWSDKQKLFIAGRCNGKTVPACSKCRAWRVNKLLQNNLPGLKDDITPEHKRDRCIECADWTLDATTAGVASFAAGDPYPTEVSEGAPPLAPHRPIPATTPAGEEKPRLEFCRLDFERMKMAMRLTFWQWTRRQRKERWTQKQGHAYLNSCGVRDHDVTRLWELKQEAVAKKDEDDAKYYNDAEGIGSFRFPAAWMATDIQPSDYIELVMHIAFLGITQANFDLCSKLFKSLKRDTAFRKHANELLEYLKQFGFPWLKAYPFGKESYGTGAWVSENWLAWARLSKILYSWVATDNYHKERPGAADILRLVSSFTALLARLMSHSGTTEEDVKTLDEFIKEFLSCIRELDILVRHESLKEPKKPEKNDDSQESTTNQNKNKQAKNGKKKKKKATTNNDEAGQNSKDDSLRPKPWWTTSNYISLLNLAGAIRAFGPMVNWWDGGGKGERFIQLIKPLITKGLRDVDWFMVRVVERFFKLDVLKRLDSMYSIFEKKDKGATKETTHDEYVLVEGALRPLEELLLQEQLALQDLQDTIAANGEADYSEVEDKQMEKAKTIYFYKSKEAFELALGECQPIAGILVHDLDSALADGGCGEQLQFYAVYRQKASESDSPFGWCKLAFDDGKGEEHAALWYSPMKKADTQTPPPRRENQLQQLAKMSAVAIPFRYAVGDGSHRSAAKYCVITNWWKERSRGGRYCFPTLDSSLYKGRDNDKLIRNLCLFDYDGSVATGHGVI